MSQFQNEDKYKNQNHPLSGESRELFKYVMMYNFIDSTRELIPLFHNSEYKEDGTIDHIFLYSYENEARKNIYEVITFTEREGQIQNETIRMQNISEKKSDVMMGDFY